eukprot:gene38122-49987_t
MAPMGISELPCLTPRVQSKIMSPFCGQDVTVIGFNTVSGSIRRSDTNRLLSSKSSWATIRSVENKGNRLVPELACLTQGVQSNIMSP